MIKIMLIATLVLPVGVMINNSMLDGLYEKAMVNTYQPEYVEMLK